jgi:hypothetical protein
MQPLPFLNPVCYCRSFLSTTAVILDFKIMQKTFLGMDSKMIPLQLLQLVKSPDFGILMMLHSHQLLSITASSHILWNTGCKVSTARTGSILTNSAFSWYVPGTFLFFKSLMAFCISSFEGGSVSISRSMGASGIIASSSGSNVSFLTDPHCRFRGVIQGMKQTYVYLWYPLFQAQWDRCDQQNRQT